MVMSKWMAIALQNTLGYLSCNSRQLYYQDNYYARVKNFVEIISRMTLNSRNSRKFRPAKFLRYTVCSRSIREWQMLEIVSLSRGNIQVAYFYLVYRHSANTHAQFPTEDTSKEERPASQLSVSILRLLLIIGKLLRPLINTFWPFDV